MLVINLILVVVLIVLSNAAMYFGAERHPDRAGRVPIRFFGLVAAVAGLYAISPLAEFPFLYMRYIMLHGHDPGHAGGVRHVPAGQAAFQVR